MYRYVHYITRTFYGNRPDFETKHLSIRLCLSKEKLSLGCYAYLSKMISTIFMFAFHLANRLKADLIKETPICLLNRAMFNSRKICVINLEKGAEKKV